MRSAADSEPVRVSVLMSACGRRSNKSYPGNRYALCSAMRSMMLSRSRLSWACPLDRVGEGDVPAVSRQLVSEVSPSAYGLESGRDHMYVSVRRGLSSSVGLAAIAANPTV